MNKTALTTALLLSLILGLLLLTTTYLLSKNQLLPGLMIAAVPFVIIVIYINFKYPMLPLLLAFIMNYFAVGLTRYVPAPLGLAVDAFLVFTWLALFFSQFNNKVNWGKALNLYTLLAVVWFSYSILQIFNPEAISKEAWFYAMRGVSLYMLLVIPLAFIVLDAPKYLLLMLNLWAFFTVLGVLKGLSQKFIGVDPWEQHWLAVIGGKTHLLAGGLRVFSFFADSATYGGSMGFSGVVFTIIGLHSTRKIQKRIYLIIGMMAIYAMFISGTRGALAVPLSGFTLYALLSKQTKILIVGFLTIGLFFFFLKFTNIGNSNYEIRRFRGGLDKNNDSFQVRVENQKKFREYLKSRPFGGGIGSAGNWGLRFTPGTFLAETPPDGWYVQIWAEQGVVGLTLYAIVMGTFLLVNSFLILFIIKNLFLNRIAIAFTSGMFGIMAASYSSGALGQMPNGIIIFLSLAFVYMMPKWERNLQLNPGEDPFKTKGTQ